MLSSEINNYRVFFKKYTGSFFGSNQYKNKNYKLKQDHTKRVCANILELCSSLNFTEQKKNIAEAIALFHDIGRFVQFKKYNTFSDEKSENHAILGLRILKETKIINKSEYKDIILSAIRFHNLKKLPNTLKDKKTILYSKLIRDADKLDIFNVLTSYYISKKTDNPALDLELPRTTSYANEVIETFLSNQCVDSKLLKGDIDFKILQLSWIYDINFNKTFKIIQHEKYIEKILSVLPKNTDVERIYAHIKKYL